MTQGINQTDGGVGYIELAYALKNNIPFATLQNKAGNFIVPSLDSVKAAADLASYPADLRFDLANTDSAQGYPITGTTWIIVYKDLSKVLKSQDRANALVDFLWWAIHEGQADAAPLFYGSIPTSLLAQDEAAVKSLNWGGDAAAPLTASSRPRTPPGSSDPGGVLRVLGGSRDDRFTGPRHRRAAQALAASARTAGSACSCASWPCSS